MPLASLLPAKNMNIFEILVEQPIINTLVAIYQGLIVLDTPYALGMAIILLTIFIRFVLYPLTTAQMRTQKKMQELAPHLSKIKEKHKGDMKRQQEATMALYREESLNPAAGCLPALIQLPIFFGLYTSLQKAVSAKSVEDINKFLYTDSLNLNRLWDTGFFGLPLGKTPSELLSTVGIGIGLVAVFTGVFQFIQSKMMIPPKLPAEAEKNLPAVKGEKKLDFASTFQTQTLYFLPIMIGVFSFGFPLGLSLYWNTFSIFGIIQQYKISGLGGLEPWVQKLRTKS